MKAPCLACKSKDITIGIATETVERLKAENAKLRNLLDEIFNNVKQGAIPNDSDPWWGAARAALGETK